ncbi:MAG: SCO family protein [Methylococcaceae bacterium]|nr:SCO family protein [Methylococcaceae bacterium]
MNFLIHPLNLTSWQTLLYFMLCCATFASTSLQAEESIPAARQSNAPAFTRTVVSYVTPDVSVIREDGKRLPFLKELDDGRPVIMNFIFASCSAICPMLSHVFSKVQTNLGKDSEKVHMVSISIDPENDTPAKLTEYAKKFGAGPNWNYYTGTVGSSIAIQKAFSAYRGDKMNHTSLILVRAAPGKPWTRLEGFVNPDAVVNEYRTLSKQ